MTNRERRLDRAAWLLQRDLEALGSDLRAAPSGIGAANFPLKTRAVLAALSGGRDPGGIVLL